MLTYTYRRRQVIGAGAVGLAIARQLASRTGTSTLLIERHGSVGTETSSRNSEVIHAGLYYGPDSLKTKLCLRGKHLLYDLCDAQNIPYSRTKKWIIAQDEQQFAELEALHAFAKRIDVPTQFLSRQEIQTQEPDVRAEAGVLESSTTGIIDSHAFMAYLEGSFDERGGDEILHTAVTKIEALGQGRDGDAGYAITTQSRDGKGGEDVITAETLINSAGLAAMDISNMILPPERHRKPYYAKGTYFSYSSSHPKPNTLLYPAPKPGLGGLGTHLTLDMAGRVRFGPDVEWIDDPTDLTPNPARLAAAIQVIKEYLPSIDVQAIGLDYCGIRPKLGRTSGTYGKDGKGFADFYITEEEGFKGFVNLLGIESPGLTSALAIAEYVEDILYGKEGASV
ncbi:NAD dehydrogenase [Cladophialophora carrionii]|uniref:L-2-hydroxyglutarate dehydrogenase, mitochondrial n=1 Tax=Cladophialophora carrionii TaxID=86049 RepID=A0A1C1CYT9_9EURO|nr:NAD dehydrogenase [Cladophialophora carrionii]